MNKTEKIKYYKKLLKEVDGMKFNKSNIKVLSDLIKNEIDRESIDENNDSHYQFTLNDISEKELDDLNNSRKKPENRTKEFKEVKSCFYYAVNGALVSAKLDD